MSTLAKFRDCLASEVESLPKVNGSVIICRDSGDMYCDTVAGDRIMLGKFIHLVTGEISSYLFPEEGHFYYSTTDPRLCFYHSGAYHPVNIDVVSVTLTDIAALAGTVTPISINDYCGDSKLATDYDGTIFKVVIEKATTDRSIIDLDEEEFIGANKLEIMAMPTASVDGQWVVTIGNNNTEYNWLGSIEVLVFMTSAII